MKSWNKTAFYKVLCAVQCFIFLFFSCGRDEKDCGQLLADAKSMESSSKSIAIQGTGLGIAIGLAFPPAGFFLMGLGNLLSFNTKEEAESLYVKHVQCKIEKQKKDEEQRIREWEEENGEEGDSDKDKDEDTLGDEE